MGTCHPKFQTNFPNFCHSLWPGAAPAAVQSSFRGACSGDRTCCFVQVLFGTRLPDTHEKHLCEPGWPLAGLAGWAEVEAVLANRAFFRINVLFLGYQTNPCVFVKAPLCKQTNTTQCSWLLSNTEVFLSVPGKKTVISFCLHLRLAQLVWDCRSGEIKRMVVRRSFPIPGLLVLSAQLRCRSRDHLQCWLRLLFLALARMGAAFTSTSLR